MQIAGAASSGPRADDDTSTSFTLADWACALERAFLGLRADPALLGAVVLRFCFLKVFSSGTIPKAAFLSCLAF
jgi:hypothetical protein